MNVKWMLTVLAVAAAVVGGLDVEPARADFCPGSSRGRRCSTPPSQRPGGKALSERMLAGARRLEPGERIVVPVVYHVIYDAHLPEGPGDPPDDLPHAPPVALVELQTEVLNRAFLGTAISFLTAHVDVRSFAPWRTRNEVGHPEPEDIVDMIVDLNAEHRRVLHVFLLRDSEMTAAPPETRKMFADFRRRTDGISMAWDYLPFEPTLHPDAPISFDEGETLVHLAGHYLGLLHTFEPWPVEGGPQCPPKCAQISDRVRDTPVHYPREGSLCAQHDTCPQYPGLDPVANYMNTEPDVCAREFTPGQLERMERMVRAYRPHLIVAAAPASPP
jgi:hypothetical protein